MILKYVYNSPILRIINPKRKSQYKIEKFRRYGRFQTPSELKSYLKEQFKELVPDSTDFNIGYYKPSCGSTKVWIKGNEDVQCMYDCCRDEINMWCEGCLEDEHLDLDSDEGSKQKIDENTKSVSKRHAIRDEVDGICFKLKEEHGSKYTPQQYRLWANMIQIGTWKDKENPPQTATFGYNGKTPSKSASLADALSGVAEGLMHALKSPTPPWKSAVSSEIVSWKSAQ